MPSAPSQPVGEAPAEDPLRRRVARAYASEAEDYQELWAPVLHAVSLELLKALPPADRVLDVATGVGTLLPALKGRVVVGVDLTHEMVELADPAFGRLVGDAAALPFRSASFDVAVLAFFLFHLSDPTQGLRESRRILRSPGVVGTITWENDSGSRAYEAWNQELERHGAPELPVPSRHELVDRPEKVATLLSEAGFNHVRVWTLPWIDEPTMDEFVQRRLRLGSTRRRLESLGPEAHRACAASAVERLTRMERADFRAEWRFVLATARS